MSSTSRFSWCSDVVFLLALSGFLGCLHHAARADRPLFAEPVNEAYAKLGSVGAGEVRSLLGKPQAILVDARSGSAYSKDTIPSAISLPLHTNIEESVLGRLKSTPEVIVFCSGTHCRAAEDLGVELRERGVQRIRVFSGGMEEWRKLGYPLVSGGL